MIESLRTAFRIPELKSRILFTLFALGIYRVGAHITAPGVDPVQIQRFMGGGGGILGLANLFSGGALQRFSIFSLGIMPYISASIMFQLLAVVIPALEKLAKEGEVGRQKITQYTRYSTVALSAFQAILMAVFLVNSAPDAVINPGIGFYISTMITLTAGSILIMWIGEQMTEFGIGNGISIIIFAGIVNQLPSALYALYRNYTLGEISILSIGTLFAVIALATALTISLTQAERKIPVQYAKRVVGRKVYGGVSQYIPLKVNAAGVMPVIFASSLLGFPSIIASLIQGKPGTWFYKILDFLSPQYPFWWILFVIVIIFFTYFYTAIIFNPVELADNMKKYGGFIPGIRPGRPTADYIDKILSKITLAGAFFLAAISVLPEILRIQWNAPFYFGGTSLLIVVGVALDTISQIESHLLTRNYEGFLKKGSLKGRK